MTFTRKSFDGLIFNWYSVDSLGAVGEFVSGYAPVPSSIFNNENEYKNVKNYFENLPEITDEYLSLKGLEESKLSYNNLFDLRAIAKKGLYSFCEPDPSDEPDTENYELIALPNLELKFEDIPEEIQSYLTLTKFESVVFKEIKVIRITEYFQCDYGNSRK